MEIKTYNLIQYLISTKKTTMISYNDISEGGQGEFEDEISPMSIAESEDDTDYFG